MGITFGGIGSGLPVNDIIEATIEAKKYRLYSYQEQQGTYKKQQSALSTVQAKYGSLESNLEKIIDSKLVHAFDLFDKKSTSVSDASIASVSTSSGADSGTITVDVNSLVAPPELTKSNFAAGISEDVKLKDLGIIDGTFSIAFEDTVNNNGILLEVEVDREDSITEFIEAINDAVSEHDDLDGTVTSSITNGQLSMDFSALATNGIQLDNGASIGNSTSNIADVFGFTGSGNTLTSESKYSLNLDGTLFGNNANINGWNSDGEVPETINIGGFEVEITEDTTLRQLMNAVNDSDESQVTMKYDQSTNSMKFEGKDNFFSDYIYFSGNAFLSEVGATVNGATEIANQIARQPGEVVIDGTTIQTKSNKLTPAETGIQGVTITVSDTTEPDEPLKITISDSTEDLEKTLSDIVGSFNSLIDTVAKYSYADTENEDYGVLRTEYGLQRMQNDIKSTLLSGIDADLEYKALSLIGISTADDSSGHLSFDKEEFLNALNDNPEDVKTLLIGNSDESIEGILEKVNTAVGKYMDVENGYFETKEDSITTSIDNLNKSIATEETRMESLRVRLTAQYAALDKTMSNYNNQMSSLGGI